MCAGALLILASNLREGRLPLMKLLHSSKDHIITIYNISQVRKNIYKTICLLSSFSPRAADCAHECSVEISPQQWVLDHFLVPGWGRVWGLVFLQC